MKLRVVILTALILTGCKDEENKSVQYYVDNPEERATMLKECEVRDASGDEANCINARLATTQTTQDENLDAADRLFGD